MKRKDKEKLEKKKVLLTLLASDDFSYGKETSEMGKVWPLSY